MTIDRLVMVGGEELVTTKFGAEVTILSCDLTGWTGKTGTTGFGKVTFGPECRVPCAVCPRLNARSDNATPLFQTEGGIPTIIVDACDLKLPPGTPMLKGMAPLHLGPGC